MIYSPLVHVPAGRLAAGCPMSPAATRTGASITMRAHLEHLALRHSLNRLTRGWAVGISAAVLSGPYRRVGRPDLTTSTTSSAVRQRTPSALREFLPSGRGMLTHRLIAS